jgi:hypothetical protein
VAKVKDSTTPEMDDYVESNFVIGPVAEKAFDEDGPHPDEMGRGPCESPERLRRELQIDQLTLALSNVQGSVLLNIS